MSLPNADDLHARLRALDAFLAQDARFVYDARLELGAPADPNDLESVEREAGLGVPEPWRTFLVTHAGRGGFCFHAGDAHQAELDVEWGGGDGGFELLDGSAMREHRERILRYDPSARDLPFLPLVKDPSSATWICVLATERGERIALVSHDDRVAEAERWAVDVFFDGWSRAGFPVDSRWEDQPDTVLAIFAAAMRLEDPESEDEGQG